VILTTLVFKKNHSTNLLLIVLCALFLNNQNIYSMKNFSIFYFLTICLLFASCVASVPSVPTSFIPENAHEIHVSASYGAPRFSGNLAYNPHPNIGFVMAGNIGRQSFENVLNVNAAFKKEFPEATKWRQYGEVGVAGYYHANDWLSLSVTPTFGQGNFTLVDFFAFSQAGTDTLVGSETRRAIFFNSCAKLKASDDFNIQFRLGFKVADNQIKFNDVSQRSQIKVGQTSKFTSVEPMVYLGAEYRHTAFFVVGGADVSGKTFSDGLFGDFRSPAFFNIGMYYTFNAAKPWEDNKKNKKKKTKS
jgi:hypothetical protein